MASSSSSSSSKGTMSNGAASKSSQQTSSPTIPALAQQWISVYKSLPVVKVAGLNVQLTLATALLLTALRYSAEAVQIFAFDWPAHHMTTKWASASVVAIFHSINLCPGLMVAFATAPSYSPASSLDTAPQWWQDLVTSLLQFCTGYMVYDGIVNILLLKSEVGMDSSDYMFLFHHIATTLYMTTVRYYRAGHQSAMICMLLGELTNPFHNSYYIAQSALTLDCCNGARMQAFFTMIEFLFAASYTLMRGFIAPLVFIHTTYDLLKNGCKNGLPLWSVTIFTLLIWGVELGSYPWILDCYNMTRNSPFLGGSGSAANATSSAASDEL